MSTVKDDPFADINDDLDGVDDFMNDPNPFEHSQGESGAIPQDDTKSTVTSMPPHYSETPINDNVNNNNNNTTNESTVNRGELPPGLINYYSRFFQLSTESFKGKFIRSLKINESIFESETYEEDKRELFGAIWITCTIVLVKFIFPGLINLVYYGIIKGVKISDSVPSNDRDKIYWNLIHCIWLFGIYSFVVPFIVLQIILKDDTSNNEEESESNNTDTARHLTINPNVKNLVGLVTVYGYGNSIWLFVLPVLDIIDRLSSKFKIALAIEWAIIAVTYVKSAQYMHMQICNRGNGHLRLPFSMIFILGFHIIFSVLLMFTLY